MLDLLVDGGVLDTAVSRARILWGVVVTQGEAGSLGD